MSSVLSSFIPRPRPVRTIFLLGLLFASTMFPVQAQESRKIQEIVGRFEQFGAVFYNLPGRQAGEKLYLYAEGLSGNFDPFIALSDQPIDIATLANDFDNRIEETITAGGDPVQVIPEFADQVFLAWDDDSGPGYAAALELNIPLDGDYQLMLISSPGRETFGDYRLQVGLEAPDVLDGTAEPTGAAIALADRQRSRAGAAIQELTGTLTESKRSTFFSLNRMDARQTLYVHAVATAGDLRPIVTLLDFGGKPVASGNFSGQETSAVMEYMFEEEADGFRIELESCCQDDTVSSGDYRLLIGLNEPSVLEGRGTTTGPQIAKQPIPVQVGVKMQQITSVDQKAENFGVVATLQMEWQDPALAFSPDTCQCGFKTFTGSSFAQFADSIGVIWPQFTLFNQQGRRDTQNAVAVVWSDGRALFFERFSVTLQAPDFDFRTFPFDTQVFFIRVDSLFGEEFFQFTNLPGFSALGDQLGEEEWIVTDFETSIENVQASTQNVTSRFNFRFGANRHLNFYIFRIFVPVGIIILVAWITFFLKDYGKRVDVSAGNLLLFIAFNFTISDDLPRLGYLTFMDTILVSTFIVTSLVIVFNVYLKRLEVTGKENFALKIDQYMIWVYPLAYIIAFALVTLLFT